MVSLERDHITSDFPSSTNFTWSILEYLDSNKQVMKILYLPGGWFLTYGFTHVMHSSKIHNITIIRSIWQYIYYLAYDKAQCIMVNIKSKSIYVNKRHDAKVLLLP